MMASFVALLAATAISFCPFVSASALVKRTSPVLPACTDFTPFTYAGCFHDPGNPSALLFRAITLDSQDMTVNECVAFCKGNGYRYAGLEYYGICFCGSSVTGPQIDESECNYPCSGNKSEICGGTDIISVYQDPTFLPVEETDITEYTALGCYSEGPNGRTLNWKQDELDGASLTVENCLTACKDEGYPFAGLEYGTECWCGVVLGNGTLPLDSSECDFPCAGDPSQSCGGGNKLNLYVAKDLESLEPCKEKPPTVSSSTYSSSTMTPPPGSTTSNSQSVTTTSNSKSTTTTSSLKLTTTTSSPTTSLSVSLCTSTTIQTPTPVCEYKCGKWCSKPLPSFTDKDECKVAVSNCAIQLTSCFLQAGWPDSLNCFKFSSWCESVSSYCGSSCPGNKCSWSSCKSKFPPSSPPTLPTPSISTSVGPCAVSTTKPATTKTTTKYTTTTSTKAVSATCQPVPPQKTCICEQPHNPAKGYTRDKPVAGIELPCLTCNNLLSDYKSGNIFKLYNNADTSKCPSYPKPSVPSGCKKACDNQYSACVNVYAEDCRGRNKLGAGLWGDNRKRTFGDSYSGAMDKCKNQWKDCYSVNSGKNPNGKCSSWNSGW